MDDVGAQHVVSGTGTARVKVLFYLGHPAHFHLFRNVIAGLFSDGHAVQLVIKKKDVLEDLVRRSGWDYQNILENERGLSKPAIAWALLKRDLRMLRIARAFRPDVMLGTSAEITHVGRLLGVPSVVLNEDDWDIVPMFARAAYPFATDILAPAVCRMGSWEEKTTKYEGYHELAYLHPNHFAPDLEVRRELVPDDTRMFVLRFAQLTAHHDAGIRGIDAGLASELIGILERHGTVFITSERPLEREFEKYRIRLDPMKMHHVLNHADLYIGDSQTMAAEAAVLGTPSVRFNDFVGRISYLEELEHRYALTIGVPATRPRDLLAQVTTLLGRSDLKTEFASKRQRMLTEKIDVAQFLTKFIEQFSPSTPNPSPLQA